MENDARQTLESKSRVNITISRRLIEKVDEMANLTGLSRSALMRLAVTRMVNDPTTFAVIPKPAP
jgi:metal-responsive CopG/Arc/MetJ family transcriptional regulator